MRVFVITDPELGWDCVVGVYQAKSKNILIKKLSKEYEMTVKEFEDNYVVHEETIKVL